MISARKMLTSVGLAAGLIVPAAAGLGSGTVSAACSGVGSSYASGPSWGLENSNPAATCDNDNNYFGYYQDTATDGWKVRVETIWINGSGSWIPTANTGGTAYYNYSDNNHFTQFRLVRADGATASTGSNSGF